MATIIRRRLAPLAAITLAAAILLAGCVPSDPPTSTPTSSPTKSTPTPTPYVPLGSPGSADPPTNSDEAWVAATRASDDFFAVQYQIQADTGANSDRIEPFATGTALTTVKSVAAQLAEKKLTTTGAPKWTPDASTSTFGTLTPTGGQPIANGIVFVRGCFDVSDQVSTYPDGTKAPVAAVRVVPVQVNVVYIVQDRAWKVSDETNITGQAGAPQC